MERLQDVNIGARDGLSAAVHFQGSGRMFRQHPVSETWVSGRREGTRLSMGS